MLIWKEDDRQVGLNPTCPPFPDRSRTLPMRLAPLTVSGTLAVACWLLPAFAQAQLARAPTFSEIRSRPVRDDPNFSLVEVSARHRRN